MTRKDYVAIAAALAKARAEYPTMQMNSAHDYVAGEVAATMAADNPRFDRERFLKAAGVQS